MTAISGQRCLTLSRHSGPLGSLVKMLLVTYPWASTKCFLTWRDRATPHKRLLFRLVPSMPRTGGIGSGLWPTLHGFSKDGKSNGPSGNELGRAVNQSLWPTIRSTDGDRGGRGDLIQAVRGNPNKHYRMWPTPKGSPSGPDYAWAGREGSGGDDLITAVARGMYPTPSSSMMTGADMVQAATAGNSMLRPTYQEAKSTMPGSLNPAWVEWLMGYPTGWTDLER